MKKRILVPGDTIGIVGGGQLGKNLITPIRHFGLNVAVLDPAESAPAGGMADIHIKGAFNDPRAYHELAKVSDVITYEFEHVDAHTLLELEKQGHIVHPNPSSLLVIQDKFKQQEAMKKAGISLPNFAAMRDMKDLTEFFRQNGPFMLKSTHGGYDGKGNFPVKTVADIIKASEWMSNLKKGGAFAEQWVNYQKEISVISTRGQDGDSVFYPIAENSHLNSVLDITEAPADISHKTHDKAYQLAEQVNKVFPGVGTQCVELFVGPNGEVDVNEVAPRVHNSGHYTIEATRTSQFENHIRAIAGYPLGKTNMTHKHAVMKNILGESGHKGKVKYTGINQAMAHGASVHIYGKKDVAPGRKMGHYTGVADSKQAARNMIISSPIKAISEQGEEKGG